MKWNRLLMVVSFLMVLGTAHPANAELFNMDPWAGLYNTGGYNLLGFGNSLYSTNQYLSGLYGSGWGGSCGSLLGSCSSPWSSAGLFGNNWGLGSMYGLGGININLDIDLNLYSLYSGLLGGSSCGGFGGFSSLCGLGSSSCGYPSLYGFGSGYNPYDIGCSLGYCGSSSYLPYYGNSMYNNNWSSLYPSTWNSFYPSTWNNSYSNPYNFSLNINYQPTSYIPSWGGCDGVIVPCSTPTIPVTPVTPWQPTYQQQQTYTPTSPVRYQIPRAATH